MKKYFRKESETAPDEFLSNLTHNDLLGRAVQLANDISNYDLYRRTLAQEFGLGEDEVDELIDEAMEVVAENTTKPANAGTYNNPSNNPGERPIDVHKSQAPHGYFVTGDKVIAGFAGEPKPVEKKKSFKDVFSKLTGYNSYNTSRTKNESTQTPFKNFWKTKIQKTTETEDETSREEKGGPGSGRKSEGGSNYKELSQADSVMGWKNYDQDIKAVSNKLHIPTNEARNIVYHLSGAKNQKEFEEMQKSRVEKPGGKVHTKKFDRCVEHVKAKGSGYNPYAVCMAAMGEGESVHSSHQRKSNDDELTDSEIEAIDLIADEMMGKTMRKDISDLERYFKGEPEDKIELERQKRKLERTSDPKIRMSIRSKIDALEEKIENGK